MVRCGAWMETRYCSLQIGYVASSIPGFETVSGIVCCNLKGLWITALPLSLMVLRITYSQRPLPDVAVVIILNYGSRRRALTCCISKVASFLWSITALN